MILFKLPDLGEGLPDAVIREWYVQVGDEVVAEQPLVAMETAKALVDVPAPQAGVIAKLFGQAGDTIETGSPLVGFVGESEQAASAPRQDAGTVVGAIEQTDAVIAESATGIHLAAQSGPKATPAVRSLAKRLGVDLTQIVADGGRITAAQVKAHAAALSLHAPATDLTALSSVRKAMLTSMSQSHAQVVPVTICDDVDLHAWQSKQDITVRLIRAVAAAVVAVPLCNASFYPNQGGYQLNSSLNLGIAVDTPKGLYVPVISDVQALSDEALREKLNQFKQQALAGEFNRDELIGATIILSNFGSIAGRYASPIIVPPMVAIIGVGRLSDQVVAVDGQPMIRPLLPLSVTTDHRLITGGESARLLRAMMDALAQAN